ncbi:helix-turn-helix transcriptional regulator [Chroococcidiopsis sp. FACHB-1243]|uniref:PadR family transcriptional regulator n=1 Tax=Chroococcidiopsis sp. [FACHB-1243] TaxID=2692781 RepID=UPI00177D3ADD|nr:PadR family transcriptional regulator [Chroococcidiopsis sp. [FACHB-1243]]MBD2306419.1 helix-turn-helix transcriptional regulator [Chroococcidiopsis sp. [FACHB-1243]]
MQLEDIYQYFANPPEIYLCQEQAVCYILSVLLEGESYGSGLIQKLEREESRYRLSDTVLYAALKFLEDEGALAGYWQKLEGRGRPRRMFRLNHQWQDEARKLAKLWSDSITKCK